MRYQSRVLHPLLAAALLAQSSACIPVIAGYYDAESEYGKSIPAPRCKPDKSWLFEVDDVSLEIFPWDGSIGLNLRVPEQFTVDMETNVLRVWRGNEQQPYRLVINEFGQIKPGSMFDRAMVNWDSRLVGGTGAGFLGFKSQMLYTVTLTPSARLSDADQFKVAMPPFRINGRRVELPVVKFSKSSRFFLAPVNC